MLVFELYVNKKIKIRSSYNILIVQPSLRIQR